MMRQFPEYGIMAIGVVRAGAAPHVVQPYIVAAVLISLATGLACGYFAGILISRFKIPAILATLRTQQLYTGIAVGITNGRPQSRLPLLDSKIGNTEFFGLFPLSFVLFLVIAVGVGLLLSRTRFGTYMYLYGTNPKAARYTGFNSASILRRTTCCPGSSPPSRASS